MNSDKGYRDVYVSAKDGLKLHVREYGPRVSDRPVVVCLPGLTRNATDFHALAEALANDPQHPLRVISVDYRGRGLSEWDPDWTHYNIYTELDDLQQVLIALAIEKATFVGTSRGGLIALGLAATASELINAVVFNDIGPVIEPQGLIRIRTYLGSMPTPTNYREAVNVLKECFDTHFPKLEDPHWEAMAHGTWCQNEGKLTPSYDPAIRKTLESIDLQKDVPPLWPMFDALTHLPVMVVRGEKSDILLHQTIEEMQSRHAQLETLTVPGQGHTPVLTHAGVREPIACFIQKVSQPWVI